jgi:Uma2 family endonuclease
MATTHDPQPAQLGKASAIPRAHRWTRTDYYRLGELGFFQNQRVELIDGRILHMSPRNPPHCITISLAFDVIRAAFGAGFYVRTQGALDLGTRSQPEPDIAVFPGAPNDYKDHHPTTALLVVEVSDSTLAYDRGRKAAVYARAAILDYWIVNLVDLQLEVYRKPMVAATRPRRFVYEEVTIVPATGVISPLAASSALIRVGDLLPERRKA